MAFIDPQAEANAVTEAVTAQIKAMFPYEGRKHDLILKGILVGTSGDVDDIRGQKQAKVSGRTWSAPLFADMELVDKATGKVVDRVKDYKLLSLPRITSRLSYIVDGAETQISHQWHLKAGAYARQKGNGELEAQFNVAGGPSGFRMEFSPQTRKYVLSYEDSNIPLHPILTRVFGMPDSTIEKAWGPQITAANKVTTPEKHVEKLYKAMFGKEPESMQEATAAIRQQFSDSKMYGEVNKITLGKDYSEVDEHALLAGSDRLLRIARGQSQPDPRDALHFKDLWGIEDYLPKRLSDMSRSVRNKIRNNLDRKDKISEIVNRDVFAAPIKGFFGTSLAERSHQVNPIAMLSDQRKTTIMGPMGGVTNNYAITLDDRLIDQSHVGFLDPIPSPEGERTGITTYLPIGAIKRGRQVYTKMYNLKSGKLEEITPEKAYSLNVAFPDQYSWSSGKPVARSKLIKVNGAGNVIDEVPPDKVDYILPSAQATFTVSTNVIPFLQNDQGNRANYAAKQISQAIPLLNREPPLVQVHTGTNDPSMTWEKVIGRQFSAHSPVSGTVMEVGSDFIKVKGDDKKTHEIPLYRNYPLNDGKTGIDSTVKVKAGDKVSKGQLVADTNYTTDGTLAMGTNVRIAYMPWSRGSTFEDGIVVSQSLAQRMTSEHLMQERLYADKGYTMDRARYRSMYPDRLTDEQAKKLEQDGVIRVGEVVQPGDTLVAALKKTEQSKEQLVLRGLHKSLSKPYSDASVTWGYDQPGVVEDVVRNGREVLVHVKTFAPLMPADKLSGRHGNKGTVSQILPDDEMPVDKDGKPVDMVFNPVGVAARINVGQVYETLLGKVAHARGEPYAVTNFAGDHSKRIVRVKGHWRTLKGADGTVKQTWVDEHERSYHQLVQQELKEAGIPAEEPLYDPKTGKEYTTADGKSGILTGYQYFLKLEHTACYSEDTEILTDSGWKLMRDVSVGERVLTMEPSTEVSSYAPVLRTFEYDYEGPMYTREANSVSLCVTPNHRLVVQPSLKASRRGWKFKEARELDGITSYYIAPTTSKWSGVSPTTMSIPAITDEKVNFSRREDLVWDFNVYATFMGWYLAEGSAFKNAKTGYQVLIAQQETSKHFGTLEAFLATTGLSWARTHAKVRGQKMCTGFVCRDGRLVRYLRQFGHSHDKFVPQEIRFASSASIQKFLDAYCMGDGYIETSRTGVKAWRITTASRRMVDDLQDLAQKVGLWASFLWNPAKTGWYQVRLNAKDGLTVSYGKMTPYVGKVYCVEVPGPGVIYVRRNGKAIWCGNSKKLAARGQGAPLPYDANMAPSGGGDSGGQRIGGLGLYALLGHGDTTAILREMNTIKSDGSQSEFWAALQAGQSLPAPKVPFAYEKFVGYLRALGVNVERKGDDLTLVPMTDKDVLARSNGPVLLNVLMRAKDLKPEKGGIFDEDITGGPGGSGWGHAVLPEPVPSPLFEKAIASLTGLNLREYRDLVNGRIGLSADNRLVPAEEAVHQAGAAIERILKNIDVDKDLEATLKAIPGASKSTLDALNKKAKYLRALKKAGVKPEEVYMVRNLPVIPPKFRPVSVLEGGDLNVDDLNGIYQQVGILLEQLRTFPKGMPPEYRNELRAGVYDALASLAGLGGSLNAEKKGIMDIIAGVGSPKGGFFVRDLLTRKQDMTMRGVIIPGSELSLDQIGLPRVAAMEMLKPFVVRDMVSLGYSPNQAKAEIDENSVAANRSLDQVAKERPVLVKRDPALHKFSVMAFWPQLIDGKAIRLHPLATGGFNADFDGDSVVGDIIVVSDTTDSWCREAKEVPVRHAGGVTAGKVIDISTFPRIESTKVTKKSGTIEYDVPAGVQVPAFLDGEFRMQPVTKFSIHPGCDEVIVATRAGRSLTCSADHSLAILDPETLEIRKGAPVESVGLCSPALAPITEVDGQDFVPLPTRAQEELATYLCGDEKTASVLGRASLVRLQGILSGRELSPYLQKWLSLVTNESVGWDMIQSAELTGNKLEMYDLTVPESWTFTMANGLLVWDTVSVYVPVTAEAVSQAKNMLPSKNIYNVATGTVMYQPTLEAQVGLYMLSRWGKEGGKKFASDVDALTAAKDRKMAYDEVITVGGKKTTAGRLLFNAALPSGMRDGPLVTDPKFELDKKGLQGLMVQMAKDHPEGFAEAMDKIKDLGFNHSHNTGMTLPFADIAPLSGIRDRALAKADKLVLEGIRKGLDTKALNELRVKAYGDATKEISVEAKEFLDKGNNVLYRMSQSGSKPSWDQIRQMIVSPILLNDGHGNPIPVPVRRSYAEGLDLAEYWTAAHGARKGVVDKTIEVAEPGALSKVIAASVVGITVTENDCGTSKGISLAGDSTDILDRFLVQPVKAGGKTFDAGTVVTPAVQSALRAAGVQKVQVRSPMRCQSRQGLCSHCMGLAPTGKPFQLRDNVGIMAGQSVGERAVQLTLKCSAGLVLTEQGMLPWSVAVDGLGLTEEYIKHGVALRPDEFKVMGREGPVTAQSVERHRPHNQVCLIKTRSGAVLLTQVDHPLIVAGAVVPGHSNRNVRLIGDRKYRCTTKNTTLRDREYADPSTRVVAAGDVTNEDAIWVDYSPLLGPDTGYTPDYDGYIAGLYAGDGCLRYGNGTDKYEGVPVAIVFTQKDKNWDAISERVLSYFGDTAGRVNSGINVYSLEAARKLGALVRSDYVASNGRRSQSKVLADAVDRIDRSWLRSFLDGLIDTDGYVVEGSGVTIARVTTTSFELAAQVHAMCVRLGAFAKTSATDDCPSRRRGDYKTAFTIEIRFPPGYTSKSIKLGPSPKPFKHAVGRAIRGFDSVEVVKPLLQWEGLVYDVKTNTSEYMAGPLQNHNSFHQGGVSGANTKVSGLDRLRQILSVPEVLPGSATLSKADGQVGGIAQDPAGGWRVQVGAESHYVPQDRGEPVVKKGDSVKRGQALSAGPLHPQELLQLTGIESVQDYISSAMESTYKGEGLKRRNFELVAKAMTGLGYVEQSGDHPEFLRGDIVPAARAQAWNQENKGKGQVKVTPMLRGLNTLPFTGTEDWMARMNFQRLKETLREGATRGWSSSLHGGHPSPGLAYGAEFGKPPSDKPWAY